MLNVGLTGGIACGKSTVSEMFVRLGAYLFDFDKLAHEVQEPGKPAWQEIIDYFGRDILERDERINRNKMAAIVFNDPEKLQVLNKIVHHRAIKEWHIRLEKIKVNDLHAIVLSETPLLFEGKLQRLFDLTILVMIPSEEQINRLMTRNDICREEAKLRLACQMPIKEKIGMADIVIDNQGTIGETGRKVEEVWRELKRIELSKKM
ncbi:MAG: dephospho-CoA kinase [Smithellaceae bacterium]